MENKEDVFDAEEIICDECQAKNDKDYYFCIKCGNELKKEKINAEKVEENTEKKEEKLVVQEEKKKGLFKNNVISKLIGFIFFFLISVSFIINTGSAIALFIFVLLAFLYCSSNFFNDFMDASFEMLGRFILMLFIFGLISFGFCMLPMFFY